MSPNELPTSSDFHGSSGDTTTAAMDQAETLSSRQAVLKLTGGIILDWVMDAMNF